MDTSFAALPIIDGHVHFIHPELMDDLLALMAAVPCEAFNLVCTPNPDGSTHNEAAYYFKQHNPGSTYISGALEYLPCLANLERAPGMLADQIVGLKRGGFDGLKLIEGKPQVRKLLPYPLDGPLYAGMWLALEQEQLPVIFHVADPDEFWDKALCPDWAKASGWDYSDGSYPSKADLYSEVDAILRRHPDLKIIFAHFYFLSNDLERLAGFLDAHPAVCVDLAPHIGMYHDFSQQAAQARQFFIHYQDRIVYGSDIDTRTLARGQAGYRLVQSFLHLIRSCLERNGEFSLPGGLVYQGLDLPLEVLEKIYASNFKRVFGVSPIPLTS
jgi:predicted TIM-barrel fold metal-dependent hydrolase